jgi:hypothetical protein
MLWLCQITRHADIHAVGQIHSIPTLREPKIRSTTIPTEFTTIFNSINNICIPVLDYQMFNADSKNIHGLYTTLCTHLCAIKGIALRSLAFCKHAHQILHKIHTKVQLLSIVNMSTHTLFPCSASSVTCRVDTAGQGNFLSRPSFLLLSSCSSSPLSLAKHEVHDV